MTDAATMNIDGGSRGNPGPAAYAVVIARDGLPPVEEADTLSPTTNNVAEYTALVRGLERATAEGVRRLHVLSDSELLVKQMNGEYKVKHADLIPLFRAAKDLTRKFDGVTLAHVRRELNKRADQLCNEAMDGRPRRRGEPPPLEEAPAPRAAPKPNESAATVRDDALACLAAAADRWASDGRNSLPVTAVWEQLWSLLEDGGLLKAKKR